MFTSCNHRLINTSELNTLACWCNNKDISLQMKLAARLYGCPREAMPLCSVGWHPAVLGNIIIKTETCVFNSELQTINLFT